MSDAVVHKHGYAVSFELHSSELDAAIAEQLGYTRAGAPVRQLLRLGRWLKLDRLCSLLGFGAGPFRTEEFERARRAAIGYVQHHASRVATDVGRMNDVVRLAGRVRNAISYEERRDALARLHSIEPDALLARLGAIGQYDAVNQLRPKLREYYQDFGSWKAGLRLAKSVYAEAVEQVKGVAGDRERAWFNARDLGWFRALTGDKDGAIHAADDALKTFSGLDERLGMAFSHRVRGFVLLHANQLQDAEAEFDLAIECAPTSAKSTLPVYLGLHRVAVFMRRDDMRGACRVLALVQDQVRAMGRLSLEISLMTKRVELLLALGRYEQARDEAYWAVTRFAGNARYEFGKASMVMARCWLQSLKSDSNGRAGHVAQAKAYHAFQDAAEAFRHIGAIEERTATEESAKLKAKLLQSKHVDVSERLAGGYPAYDPIEVD